MNLIRLTSIILMTLPLSALSATKTSITQQVIRVATQYNHSIACGSSEITEVLPLIPYTSDDDRWDAQYAVLWSGDIGCQGGSGTSGANITIVKIGAGDYYYVDSLQSSPNINYESPTRWVTKIISYAKDQLVLQGKTYSDKDPNCCPSLTTQFTLQRDNKGNWLNKEAHQINPIK